MNATALDHGLLPPPREIGLWAGAAIVVIAAHALIAYGFQALRPVDMPEAAEVALTIDLSPLAVTAPEAVESEALDGEIPQEVLEPVPETAEVPQEATTEMAEAVEDPLQAAQAAPTEITETQPTETAAVRPEEAIEPVEDTDPVQPSQTEAVEPSQAETAEASEPVTETVEQIEPDAVASAEPDETVEPTEQPEIVETLQAEQVDEVLPDVIAALPQPKPIVEEEEPVEKPVRKAEPRKAERKKPAAAKPAPKAEAKAAERTQEAKTAKAAPSKSSAKSTASRAPSISPAKWQSRVIAWINRHKRYPSKSKARGDQGQVQVNFAINASGVVVSASIGRSSGNAELDRAALDMVRRASPVPAPPPEIARSRMQLALPVQFSLR